MKKLYYQTILFLRPYVIIFCIVFSFTNCQAQKSSSTLETDQNPPFTLHFIGEQIIPVDEKFGTNEAEKMTVGGLSGIDYNEEKDIYYLLSDDLFDENGRLRFYTAQLNYTKDSFESLKINSVNFLKQENNRLYPTKSEGMKIADPESICYSSRSNTLFWSSEGDRERNILPFIAEMDTNGNLIQKLKLPKHFIDTTKNKGWFHNAAIEALTLAENEEKIWFLSETPLWQDGEMTKKTEGIFPIRLIGLDRKTSTFEKEFIYLAEPLDKEPIPQTAYGLNGIVEILEWKTDKNKDSETTQFLVLERSYSAGYPKGANTVRLFLVDIQGATDSKNIESLKNLIPNKDYIPLKKQLIADLSTMNLSHIDNIEGMSLGKKLDNGNQTLIFISDNNFQAIQKTQFLVFEIIEE